ncbi:coiled-coil domain-containing protein 117 [Pyxicephalus adspersus]|uniref:Coiled-coil domain-containing protein 117 n=1 Tax=Pyxicephalus adspersus TaxID=30357 RepID=A0AAV3AJT2_PYXAD|nr:TPA: hypothetical protein GDO54_014210 [Pyxicephalus adspersus]
MAAVDRAFSAIPLCRMEYPQQGSFLQRTNVNSPFLDTSGNQHNLINSIPLNSSFNNNGSCFNVCNSFLTNPVTGEESLGMLMGNALPMVQSPDRTHVLSQACTGPGGRIRRKHKHDQDDIDCPLKRRKICESPILEKSQAPATYTGDTSQPCWSPSHPHVTPAAVAPSLCIPSPEIQAPLPEDMEETTIESQSDAALRRIRDIESRLVLDEDDDEEEDSKDDRLPTLVMSDILVESLKKGLDESLTKKIVDSMNRPSMEIVLWKPQPEFLIDKLQSFSSRHDDDETTASTQVAPEMPFLRQVEPLETDKPQTLNLDCNIDPMWGREEEEMELS